MEKQKIRKPKAEKAVKIKAGQLIESGETTVKIGDTGLMLVNAEIEIEKDLSISISADYADQHPSVIAALGEGVKETCKDKDEQFSYIDYELYSGLVVTLWV
jgi:hypothetical protein